MEDGKDDTGLADALFGKANYDTAIDGLNTAKKFLDLGDTKRAAEQLRMVGMASAIALTSLSSPKLTDEENKEWLQLQKQAYLVNAKGFISIRILPDNGQARLDFLSKKAFSKEK